MKWRTCKAISPPRTCCSSEIAAKIGLDPVPLIDNPPDDENASDDEDPKD